MFVSWIALPDVGFGPWVTPESCTDFPTWPTARYAALQAACLAGVRYVSVQRPGDDVVAGEYDRYTKRWRQYRRALVDVDHVTEVTPERGAMAAWCTCGWARFLFHGPSRTAAEAAGGQVRNWASDHENDPATQ
jgi:hypothetical protein